MAYDFGLGIILLQVFQEKEDRCLLSLSAGVSRTAFFVKATFVTDANGMLVVMADMSASSPFRTTFVVLTITGDIPVVATVKGHASRPVTALQVFEGEAPVAAGGTAM